MNRYGEWTSAVDLDDALEYEPGRPLLALSLRLSIVLRELWLRRKRLGFLTGACRARLAKEGCFLQKMCSAAAVG